MKRTVTICDRCKARGDDDKEMPTIVLTNTDGKVFDLDICHDCRCDYYAWASRENEG